MCLALGPIDQTHAVRPSPTHKLKVHLDHANFVKEIRPCLGS